MALTFKQALAYFWQQISAQFVRQESGKGLSENNFTTAEKNKLAALNTNANGTITGVTAGSGLTGGGTSGTVTLNIVTDRGLDTTGNKIGHSNSIAAGTSSEGGNARTLAFGGTFKVPSITYDAQGHIKSVGSTTLTMPANPDTDTTYEPATTSKAGLMSAADKEKLDGIASGATANTGDITGVTAGKGLTGGATSGTATLNVGAGVGITVSADAVAAKLRSTTALTVDSAAATTTTNRVYPVAVDKSGYLAVNIPWNDTTYSTITNAEIDSICGQTLALVGEVSW